MGKMPDAGQRLRRVILDAGLPPPTIIEREALGLATEMDVDCLAMRLETESVALGCQLLEPTQYRAQVRRP
jgi:hypothetical protein